MTNPCERCITLAVCKWKENINCRFLIEYFNNYKAKIYEEEREVRKTRFLQIHVRDVLWLETWEHIQEVLPNCNGMTYPISTKRIGYSVTQTMHEGITYV